LEALHAAVWPEYNRHGVNLNRHWPALATEFPEYQQVLVDPGGDRVRAGANAIPCGWDGTVPGLPSGIDDVISQGVALKRSGGRPNTLSALAIVVAEEERGGGLSTQMIGAMRALAHAHGFGAVIVPLRPVWKERYPLTPIERYTVWRRGDGLPFDPWLRTHVRLGGEILRPAPRSLYITGSVSEWEEWTGMAFPDDGPYVFPHGLAVLTVDHAADVGDYWEPNIWVAHRAG
jgi:GNAT superfamily N-acetyltransferase